MAALVHRPGGDERRQRTGVAGADPARPARVVRGRRRGAQRGEEAEPPNPRRQRPEADGDRKQRRDLRVAIDPARRGTSSAGDDEPGLHPDLRWDGGAFQALLVGHELVGLPEPAAAPTVPCYAGGQARAAVAVALAGRGLRPGDEIRPAKSRSTPDSRYDDPSVTTLTEEDWEIDTEPAVVHSESDLTVARALLRRPVDEVRAVLADDWARWVDPDTPTSDLAAAFGLDADRPSETPEGLAPCT